MSPAMKKMEHYSVQKVTGDGRCMFRALVKLVNCIIYVCLPVTVFVIMYCSLFSSN